MGRTMHIRETAYVQVHADRRWNDSGIDVMLGQIYNFAVPRSEIWMHRHIQSDANGWTSSKLLLRVLERFRRVRKANWLELIGTIGKSSDAPLLIGSQLTAFTPRTSGRLYLFANGAHFTYWNNAGVVAVRVTRTK
jgi:hypothetical protein